MTAVWWWYGQWWDIRSSQRRQQLWSPVSAPASAMADQETGQTRGRGQGPGRARSRSEDPALAGAMCQVAELRRGESYDMDGKFSYSQVSCPLTVGGCIALS